MRVLAIAFVILLSGPGMVTPTRAAERTAGGMARAEVYRQVAALTAIGRRMFADPALSPAKLACASCHSPEHAFGPPNALPVQLGGDKLRQPGLRAVPSLRYLQAAPPFTEHFFDSDDEGDESVDNGPTGGLTWDGRVDGGSAQARIPLLSPFEMGNPDPAAVVARVERAGYGAELRRALGMAAPATTEEMFRATLKAFEVFEQDSAAFYPYSSRYDAYLGGRAELTAQELRGLELFEAPDKGNCASCHLSGRAGDGTPPQFTDYGLIALGVPRNPAIPANADPGYHDLGLCGPLRRDFHDRPDYCGLFRTPSLRNVATRQTFFHNGVVHSLRRAVAFYVERDTTPERWYSRNLDGSVHKFDDLPPAYQANVNTDPPFGRRGGAPALSQHEIDDVVAFLGTLTDGYQDR